MPLTNTPLTADTVYRDLRERNCLLEIDELVEAMEGTSADHVAEIRSKYMLMLLTRFNEYLTRPLI